MTSPYPPGVWVLCEHPERPWVRGTGAHVHRAPCRGCRIGVQATMARSTDPAHRAYLATVLAIIDPGGPHAPDATT